MKEQKNQKKLNNLLQKFRKKVWLQAVVAISTVALVLVLVLPASVKTSTHRA